MKTPKNWDKMTRQDQEEWLVKKYQDAVHLADTLKRLLATVRGGQRVVMPEIDRPDELLLKDI
jgi:hypothetical protein